MEKWNCSVCGYIHEGPLPADFVCPVCKHPQRSPEKRTVKFGFPGK